MGRLTYEHGEGFQEHYHEGYALKEKKKVSFFVVVNLALVVGDLIVLVGRLYRKRILDLKNASRLWICQ